jgi:hypothetical protein
VGPGVVPGVGQGVGPGVEDSLFQGSQEKVGAAMKGVGTAPVNLELI